MIYNKPYPKGFYWDYELGYGHHGAKPIAYTESYFENYRERDKTEMGRELTLARASLASSIDASKNLCVDIGIGGGAFVLATGFKGFDVCPTAIDWLESSDDYVDPFNEQVDAATFWDSLEHIPEPWKVLNNIRKRCYISMPIYQDKEHCLNSKHYKPGEHIFYFTHDGLIKFMSYFGFDLVRYSDIESRIGREDIISYEFIRRNRV